MAKQRWTGWYAVLAGVLLTGSALTGLLYSQGAPRAGWLTAGGFSVVLLAWLYIGLARLWDRRWAKLLGSFGLSGLAMLLLGFTFWQAGLPGGTVAAAGTWAMAALFVVGLALLRLLLSPGHPIFGIARTVIDEAIRMRVALIFIICLLLVLPTLPVLLDPAERLQYRMQFLLSWSLTITSLLLSLLTVFVTCWTICNDIQQKQIYMTMTKSVRRFDYLAGKWLGVVLLNLLLLSVAGGGTYVFARMLERASAVSEYDRIAVEEQVLVARATVGPRPTESTNLPAQLQEQIARVVRDDPERYPNGQITPQEQDEIQKRLIARWHTLPPQGSQTFVFTNLAPARQFGEYVQLRFKPKMNPSPEDDMVNLAFWLNDRPFPQQQGMHQPIRVAVDNYHVLDLPLAALDQNGNLAVRIANVTLNEAGQPAGTVSFSPGKDLEVLYRVGGFEGNFIRSLLLLWIRLACLTMLALAAGTFLGFPVACLLTLMVYFTAGASSFLDDSLRFYAGVTTTNLPFREVVSAFLGSLAKSWNEGKYWDVCKLFIRVMGETFIALVPSFSHYDPVSDLADGRLVPWRLVGSAAVMIGLLWTGLCTLIGWLIFKFRELARVTV